MSNILKPRPDDRPPQREDWGKGVTISVAAHLALVGALIWGVHWHSKDEPEGTSAELWAAVPTAAAPPPTEPPPPPPEPATPPAPRPAPTPPPPPPPAVETPKPPDIVTEKLEDKKKKLAQQKLQQQQELQAKLDKQKADQDKADKAKADKAKADALKQQQAQQQADQKAQQQKQLDAQKLAKLHDENVRRMMGQMGAPANATGTAARDAGPSASYGGRIKARVRPNIVLTTNIDGNPTTEVEVRCAPDGTIIGRRITKSSGNKDWDDTVLRAIDRTGVLPRDTDGRVPSPMLLTFNPDDAPG